MIKLRMCWLVLVLFLVKISVAQHQYYKLLTPAIVLQFTDTTKKINFKTPDTTANYSSLLNYVLRFYPNILFKSVKVYTQPSQTVTKLKPTFFSIFKAPQQRAYKLYFSTLTHTTLDSVLLKQLSYNSSRRPEAPSPVAEAPVRAESRQRRCSWCSHMQVLRLAARSANRSHLHRFDGEPADSITDAFRSIVRVPMRHADRLFFGIDPRPAPLDGDRLLDRANGLAVR